MRRCSSLYIPYKRKVPQYTNLLQLRHKVVDFIKLPMMQEMEKMSTIMMTEEKEKIFYDQNIKLKLSSFIITKEIKINQMVEFLRIYFALFDNLCIFSLIISLTQSVL